MHERALSKGFHVQIGIIVCGFLMPAFIGHMTFIGRFTFGKILGSLFHFTCHLHNKMSAPFSQDQQEHTCS